MAGVVYQIRVAGAVPDRFFEDFTGVVIVAGPEGTTLRADLIDQAELNGVLNALRRAGLDLLEVRREQFPSSPEAPPDSDASGGPRISPG